MTEYIYDSYTGEKTRVRSDRKGKRLGLSFSCYPVKNTREAVFVLLEKIIDQAREDKKYHDSGKAPVGMRGYGVGKNGKVYRQSKLKEDPIREINESWIMEKCKQYYQEKGIKEKEEMV